MIGCHELITGDRYYMATGTVEVAVDAGKVGVLVVGGGAPGYRSQSGGASGYFKYQVVNVVNDKARVYITIGSGGSGVSIIISEPRLLTRTHCSIIKVTVGRPMFMLIMGDQIKFTCMRAEQHGKRK